MRISKMQFNSEKPSMKSVDMKSATCAMTMNAPKSKIYLFLLIVIGLYLATFFIQIRLISSQSRSESGEYRVSIEESRRIKQALGLSGEKLANMVINTFFFNLNKIQKYKKIKTQRFELILRHVRNSSTPTSN